MLDKRVPILLVAVLTAGGVQAATVRTLEEKLALAPGDVLELDLPVGELRVEGTATEGGNLRVEIECSKWRRRCQSAAEGIEIDVHRRGGRVRVELDGWPRWGTGGLSVSVFVEVPHSSALNVDMGVGQVTIAGLHSNLSIDLGIGDVEVEMAAEFVHSVNLESGIGESTMALDGESVSNKRSFLGDELRWSEGSGEARIDIDLGIGAIDVDLD